MARRNCWEVLLDRSTKAVDMARQDLVVHDARAAAGDNVRLVQQESLAHGEQATRG